MKTLNALLQILVVISVIVFYIKSIKYIRRIKKDLYAHQKEWNDYVDGLIYKYKGTDLEQFVNDHFKKVKITKL